MASFSLRKAQVQQPCTPRRRHVVLAYLPSGVPPNVQEARVWIAAWKARHVSAAPVAPKVEAPPPNVIEARKWIAAWKTRRSLEASLSAQPEAEPAAEASSPAPPHNVVEAREWIAAWKARNQMAASAHTAMEPVAAAPMESPVPIAADPATPPSVAGTSLEVGEPVAAAAEPVVSPGPVMSADGTITFNKDVLDTATYADLLKALKAKEEKAL